MKTLKNSKKMNAMLQMLRKRGKRIGFVPTMGALHEGHLSLVRKSKKESDVTVVSIFVNPLQFGPKEDFKRYPRTLKADLRALRKEKVDFVFIPSQRQIYPKGAQMRAKGGQEGLSKNLTKVLCGKSRPGHFKGVVTVVNKLFHIICPHRAYFGAKDYQQARVIEKMVEDLGLPVTLRVLPIVRERDGLALSSRNQYLNSRDRVRARALSETLFWMRGELKRRVSVAKIKRQARRKLATYVDRIDYLELVDPKSLQGIKRRQHRMVALTACIVGKTRLIDNVIIRV